MSYNFNSFKKKANKRLNKHINFKQATVIQDIINSQKWDVKYVNMILPAPKFIIPDSTMLRDINDDYLNFENHAKRFSNFLHFTCKDKESIHLTVFIFPEENLKIVQSAVEKLFKLKTFF